MANKKENKIDIILPNFNSSGYIKETIKSIIDQTFKNWNLIIVDDCSDKKTKSILQKFSTNKKIKIFWLKKNKGAGFCRNLAIKKSKSLKPDYADAYNNLGTVLRDQGDFKEAIKVFKKAISLQPDHTESYNNLGVSLSDQGRIDESIEAHKKAILLKPNFEMARTSKIYQQAQICDWKGIRDERNWIPKLGIGKQAIRPFHLLSIEDSPLRHKKRAENYNKNKGTDKISLFNTKEIESHKPIKIGYFSSDFKEHPTAYLIAKVIEIHNREEFKVYGYSIKDTRKDLSLIHI